MNTLTPHARAKRDAEIQHLAFDQGMPIHEIENLYPTITGSRIGQILQVSGLRNRIWNYLAAHPDEAFTSRELAQELKLDINKVAYAVDSLRKKGAVDGDKNQGGTHNGSGDHHQWTGIHLLRMPPATTRAPEVWAAPEPEPEPYDTSDVLLSPIAPPEPSKVEGVQVAPTPEPPVEPTPSLDVLEAHDIPRYPLLVHLLERDGHLQAAAKLLERAGVDDLALQVLAKTDDFTPLEREFMRFARDKCGEGD